MSETNEMFRHDLIQTIEDEEAQMNLFGMVLNRARVFRIVMSVLAVIVALYTGVHGMHLVNRFYESTAGEWSMEAMTAKAGIVVTELAFLFLVHGVINGSFRGSVVYQSVIGFAILLTIVGISMNTALDSALNAGFALTENEAMYLRWGVPLMPFFVIVLYMVAEYLSPEATRNRKQANMVEAHEHEKFRANMAGRQAELRVEKAIASAQLEARMKAAEVAVTAFRSPEALTAITNSALKAVPHLLASIGIDPADIDLNNDGQISRAEVAAYVEENPSMAGQMATWLSGMSRQPEPMVYGLGGGPGEEPTPTPQPQVEFFAQTSAGEENFTQGNGQA